MKRGMALGMVLATATVIGIPAYAHHSFSAHYFEEQTMSIAGELTQFEYRSLHAG